MLVPKNYLDVAAKQVQIFQIRQLTLLDLLYQHDLPFRQSWDVYTRRVCFPR
jgi:hypothetical protein